MTISHPLLSSNQTHPYYPYQHLSHNSLKFIHDPHNNTWSILIVQLISCEFVGNNRFSCILSLLSENSSTQLITTQPNWHHTGAAPHQWRSISLAAAWRGTNWERGDVEWLAAHWCGKKMERMESHVRITGGWLHHNFACRRRHRPHINLRTNTRDHTDADSL